MTFGSDIDKHSCKYIVTAKEMPISNLKILAVSVRISQKWGKNLFFEYKFFAKFGSDIDKHSCKYIVTAKHMHISNLKILAASVQKISKNGNF